MFNTIVRNLRNKPKITLKTGNISLTKSGQMCIDTGKYKGRNPPGRRVVQGKHNVFFDKDFIPLGRNDMDILENHFIKNIIPKQPMIYNSFGSIGLDNKYLGINFGLYSTHKYSEYFLSNMFHKYSTNITKKYNIYHFPFESINLSDISSEIPDEGTIIDIVKKQIIIYGSGYSGEIKKSAFVAMNYECLEKGVLPMHCSAQLNPNDNKTTLFFGLSGTGKTTHSLRKDRVIIGDDEHGWSEEGIFNFENGFYAKTDGINADNEPLIYENIYGNSLCENVMTKNDKFDFNDTSITKNGRVSIPLSNLDKKLYYGRQIAPHPKYIIFLSCDVMGVLPHCVRLTKEQAIDYYSLGYTSKTPGTEQGILEPTLTFSPCFGKVFMPHQLSKYQELFKKYLDKYNPQIFMINTGWVNGDFSSGYRIDLEKTRKTIDLIQNGKLNYVQYFKDHIFKYNIPHLNHITPPENYPMINDKWEMKAVILNQKFQDKLKA